MTSPFDDPQFRAQMAEMGVTHQPGMAADLLAQIAPLLAADGIDMDNLDAADLDSVNAALDRAMAQHNFMLFTPVGVHREGALSLLRDVAIALADENTQRAASLLSTIESEPTEHAPSVAHVTGTALGLLDAWHTEAAPKALAHARVPRWSSSRSRKAATDILGLARKGRAFDSIDGLFRRHTGQPIFEGAALAVAGVVAAWAASDDASVEALVNRVISDTAYRAPAGSAFRRPVSPPRGGTSVADGFREWLEDAAPDIGAPTVDEEAQLFDGLMRLAEALSLDISEPDGAVALLDEFFEAEDDFPLEAALLTLYDYAQFQIDESRDPDAWESLAAQIEDELEADAPVMAALEDAIAEDATIAENDLRHALELTRMVDAVGPLLEWVGSGRAVTATGNVRRADIAAVAGLIGVEAIGVSKSPPLDKKDYDRIMAGEEPSLYRVLSLSEVPMVSQWWEALQVSDVIAVSGTKVKPGPAAAAWLDGSVALAEVQMFVSIFISEVIGSTDATDLFGLRRRAALMREMHRALAPDDFADTENAGDPLADALGTGARLTMARLARLGISELDADGSVVVQRELRGTVAKGVTIAMAMLRALFDE